MELAAGVQGVPHSFAVASTCRGGERPPQPESQHLGSFKEHVCLRVPFQALLGCGYHSLENSPEEVALLHLCWI